MDRKTAMADTAGLSGVRRTSFSALAALFAILAGGLLFGWIGLFLGWVDDTDGGIHRIHNVAGSGVATGLFVATPLLILAWRRRDVALVQMVAVAAVGYGVACVLATDWVALLFVPILLMPVVVLAAVGRLGRDVLRGGEGFGVFTLVVTIASAVFWVPYALQMATFQRIGPPSDPHVQMHHWTSMAGMALGIVLLGILASLRTRGWRIVVWLVAAGSAVYGIASIVFAHFPGTTVPYPGGEGVGWGLLAILGGVLLVAAAELDARRGSVTP
jgi:hypothetical protein